MPVLWTFLIVLALAGCAYLLGRARAISVADGDARKLHSLPAYYGWFGVLLTAVPSLLVMAAWLLITPILIDARVVATLDMTALPEDSTQALVMSDVRRVASGLDVAVEQGVLAEDALVASPELAEGMRALLGDLGVALGSDVSPEVLGAAIAYRDLASQSYSLMTIVVLGLAVLGLVGAYLKIAPEFRARNVVELGIKALLILCSSIAILTTVGIVLSMLFETSRFFQDYPWQRFFFGTSWNPSFSGRGGGSDLGILPLLWGTLYISFLALLVAVPIGLYTAIYLSEYASPRSCTGCLR